MGEAPRQAGAAPPAHFVTGSTFRHVVVMGATGSAGLMAIFVVDLLSLLYIARLGDPVLTAAVGFATIVQIFAVSINIGMMIAVGALVSRALGRGDVGEARRLAASSLVLAVAASAVVTVLMLPLLTPFLTLIGAGPETVPAARTFLWIALPSTLTMALGMGFSGVLRAVGDARRAMNVTLAGAAVTALLDPLLIFGLHLGVEGAAITIVIARLAFAWVGYSGAVRVHRMVARPSLAAVVADAGPILRVALPTVLTNLAPPVASAYLAHVMAGFGTATVAGNAVVDRMVPVAFGGLFALSGAVGPILGQNWGAGRFDRMRATLRDAALVTGLYVAVIWLALLLGRGPLTALFGLSGAGADLLAFFCLAGGAIWFFNGLLFLGNASFNNLGFPLAASALNWGRATIGTMPTAWLGAHLAGPEGAMAGMGIGSALFGVVGLVLAFRVVGVLERREGAANPGAEPERPAKGGMRAPSQATDAALREPAPDP